MSVLNKKEKLDCVEVLGIPMLFTSQRIDHAEVPEGLYVYDVRGDDEGGFDPVELAKGVLVNHFGTVFSKTPIELTPSQITTNAYRVIDPEKDWKYLGTSKTIEEFLS